jgi:tRNA (guanine-N7-)-methyltransferase
MRASNQGPEARKVHKLYGRRKGPKLSLHQERLLETLLPRLALDLEPGRDPKNYFISPVEDVWLEIGFGAGEHLVWQAEHHPRIGLIGAEPYVSGVAKLLSKLTAGESDSASISLSPTGGEGKARPNKVRTSAGEGVHPPVSVPNVNAQTSIPPHPDPLPRWGRGEIRVYPGDAREILDTLPDSSLGRVFILFPDPWPKTRHHKRRFIQIDTLDTLARVMKPGAELRFASDDEDYLNWSLERLMAHPAFIWTATCARDWQTRPDDWPQTRYESKALHGAPAFLRFKRL